MTTVQVSNDNDNNALSHMEHSFRNGAEAARRGGVRRARPDDHRGEASDTTIDKPFPVVGPCLRRQKGQRDKQDRNKTGNETKTTQNGMQVRQRSSTCK